MSRTGILIGVGLGPGDPDLITVKGLKALQTSDIIFFPATEVSSGGYTSFSAKILEPLDLDVPLKPLFIPMSGENRAENYGEAFRQIASEIALGKRVAVVSEGDLLFYSTFGYLFKLAKAAGVECNLIPGIPAYIAAGSEGDLPIVEGNQQFRVVARPDSFEQIGEQLNSNSTVVIMKMSVLKGWYKFLKESNKSFFYIERVGTTQQFSTSDVKDLESRKIPYFSLIIFYA